MAPLPPTTERRRLRRGGGVFLPAHQPRTDVTCKAGSVFPNVAQLRPTHMTTRFMKTSKETLKKKFFDFIHI